MNGEGMKQRCEEREGVRDDFESSERGYIYISLGQKIQIKIYIFC